MQQEQSTTTRTVQAAGRQLRVFEAVASFLGRSRQHAAPPPRPETDTAGRSGTALVTPPRRSEGLGESE